MSVRNAILKTKIEQKIVELMVKSQVTNIYMDDGSTTLAAKLAEMVASINEKAKKTEVTSEISSAVSTAIDGLIAGAPGTYDTLKEIADYIAAHEEVTTALNAAIGNKVDKVEGKQLSTEDFTTAYKTVLDGIGALASKDKITETDLDETLKEKVNAAAEGNHSHDNKTVLDGITAEDVEAWDAKAKIYVQDTQPETLATGELWIQPLA